MGLNAAPQRPWWGNPWLWVAICVAFAILGLFVWRGLFGGTFLFLPFVWVRKARRSEPSDSRASRPEWRY